MAEVADDLADIRAHNAKPGPSCSTGIALSAMDPATRDKVFRAVADPTVENKAIVRWLATLGIDIPYESFKRHIRGECRCGR